MSAWWTNTDEARVEKAIERIEYDRDPGDPLQLQRDQDGLDRYERELTRGWDAA